MLTMELESKLNDLKSFEDLKNKVQAQENTIEAFKHLVDVRSNMFYFH